MKKLMLSAIAILLASASFAQAKWGVVAGPTFSSYTLKVLGSKSTSDIITNFRGGVTLDLPIADEFYVQPSLLYTGKGGKGDFLTRDVKTNLHYLELPVNFMYKPEVGAGNLFIGIGPYLAYALGGNVNGNSIDFGNQAGELKRFDVGGNFQVGYELSNGINFGLYTDLGLVNLAGDGDSDNSFRNTSFGVNIGYKFGGK
ncbi:porin family protein [Chitinophaga skermanii]|nr:porin family protein [Chitinophaga skermanii]